MDEIKERLTELKLQLVNGDRNIFHEKILSLAPAIVVHVETGIIVHATESINLMFGFLINEIEGMPVENLMPEEFRKRHAVHLKNYLKIPKQRNMGLHEMPLKGQRKTGEEFNIRISLYPFVVDQTLFTLGFIMQI